jgi:hypothetical protein
MPANSTKSKTLRVYTMIESQVFPFSLLIVNRTYSGTVQ